jgi:hypothetical protein
MPTYLYRVDDEIVPVTMTVKQMLRCKRKGGTSKLPDGRIGTRDIAAEHNGFQDVSEKNFPKGKVQDNWSVAVHPDQIPEARAMASSLGVATEFSRDGSPQFTSHTHRKTFLRKMGYVDRSAWS